MASDIGAEMRAATLAIGFKPVRALIAAGAPARLVAELLERFELGRVRAIEGERFWEPQEDGAARLALAVHSGPDLVDIVAFAPASPDRWTLRRGAGVMLGEDALWHACAMRGPGARTIVAVHATPMAWLRAGGEGVCVLDWSAEALGMLRMLGPEVTLLAADAGAAVKLRDALAYGALPKVAARPAGRLAA